MSLFVQCARDQYFSWIGVCSECHQDHEIKYIKVADKHNSVYVALPNSKDIKVLECEYLTHKLSDALSRELNVFTKQVDHEIDRIRMENTSSC